MLARAIVAEKAAAFELARAPVSPDGKSSPWLAVWQGQVRAVTTLARMLSLSPGGRVPTSSVKKAEPPTASYYEKMSLEARDGPEPN